MTISVFLDVHGVTRMRPACIVSQNRALKSAMLAGAVQTVVVSGAAGASHGSGKQSVRWCKMCFCHFG